MPWLWRSAIVDGSEHAVGVVVRRRRLRSPTAGCRSGSRRPGRCRARAEVEEVGALVVDRTDCRSVSVGSGSACGSSKPRSSERERRRVGVAVAVQVHEARTAWSSRRGTRRTATELVGQAGRDSDARGRRRRQRRRRRRHREESPQGRREPVGDRRQHSCRPGSGRGAGRSASASASSSGRACACPTASRVGVIGVARTRVGGASAESASRSASESRSTSAESACRSAYVVAVGGIGVFVRVGVFVGGSGVLVRVGVFGRRRRSRRVRPRRRVRRRRRPRRRVGRRERRVVARRACSTA